MLSEAVNVNEFFPLAFREHLIFGIVGVVFFLFQYYRLKRNYQVLMALAIGATFLLYLGKSMHNIIGIVELVLMTLVVVSLVKDSIDEKKKKKENDGNEQTEAEKKDDEPTEDDNNDGADSTQTEASENGSME
ncbi:MAG: hypothetical protein IJO29_06890 [Oscillospiraceae bacterium]|nr:hypothetical protein [Oscillospiraceae bacterium]